MRIIRSQPSDITTILFNLGSRTLVLVEGESDEEIFEEWFRERLADIMFFSPGGGWRGVEGRLKELIAISEQGRVFGIRDRDFKSDIEVENSFNDPNSHLFILPRYSIENYLLVPEAIREELRIYYGKSNVVPDISAITIDLLRYCTKLTTLMAANWIFSEVGDATHYTYGHDLLPRQEILSSFAIKIGCSLVEATRRIEVKEKMILPTLVMLETAHKFINGKHLFHHTHLYYTTKIDGAPSRDHLRGLLARTIKRMGIHADIRDIIEQRVLNNNP